MIMFNKTCLFSALVLATALVQARPGPAWVRRQEDAQSSLTLDPAVISNGLAQDGQGNNPDPGQVRSATSTNNFINHCLLSLDKGVPLTDGQQKADGSCNQVPMGRIIGINKAPRCKFVFPKNGDESIVENTAFTVQMRMVNMQAGNFVNAQANYYAAPQQVNNDGILIGHSHIVIEPLPSIDSTEPLDPLAFKFFKGLNDPADGAGILQTTVTAGLPKGVYRMCSINTAANHQPAMVSKAQHGALDDCSYFTVRGAGEQNNNNGQNGQGQNGQGQNGQGQNGQGQNGQGQNGQGQNGQGQNGQGQNGQGQNGQGQGQNGGNGNVASSSTETGSSTSSTSNSAAPESTPGNNGQNGGTPTQTQGSTSAAPPEASQGNNGQQGNPGQGNPGGEQNQGGQNNQGQQGQGGQTPAPEQQGNNGQQGTPGSTSAAPPEASQGNNGQNGGTPTETQGSSAAPPEASQGNNGQQGNPGQGNPGGEQNQGGQNNQGQPGQGGQTPAPEQQGNNGQQGQNGPNAPQGQNGTPEQNGQSGTPEQNGRGRRRSHNRRQ